MFVDGAWTACDGPVLKSGEPFLGLFKEGVIGAVAAYFDARLNEGSALLGEPCVAMNLVEEPKGLDLGEPSLVRAV